LDFPSNWTRPGATSRPSSLRSRAEPLTRSLQRYLLFVRVFAEHVSKQQCRDVCCSTTQIMLRQPFNQRADVYSFGMVLWGIYTCKQLYPHHQCVLTAFLGVLTGGLLAASNDKHILLRVQRHRHVHASHRGRRATSHPRRLPPIASRAYAGLLARRPRATVFLLFLSQSAPPPPPTLLRRVVVALTLTPSSCVGSVAVLSHQDTGSMRSTSDWMSF
jgi:hypothetical protein